MKKIILVFHLLLFPIAAIAQTPFWHQTNGPEAGNVSNISIDSSGRVIVWTAGSGAFRSSDNGNTWELLNHGLPKAQLYIGAATASGYLIAANAPADGQLFRYNENDPNAQWVDITPFGRTVTVTINDILADPNGEIYLAAGSHGVLRSDDNGTTWKVKGHLIDTTLTFPHLSFDDNTSFLSIDGNGNLFAGLAGNGAIYRSNDKGGTWTKLPARTPGGQKALSTMLAAPNGNIIVGTQQPNLSTGGQIYVSTDTAKTWKSVYQRPATTEEQKNNIDKLICVPGMDVIYCNAHGPTLRSLDNGLTWVPQDTNKRGDEVFCMAAQGNYLFQLCEPDGIFLSTDQGVNWVAKNKGVYAEYMWGIAINSKQNLFAITEYGLWGSTDNGDSWGHKPEYGEDYNPSIFIDKKDYIFIGTNKGLFRSKDDGQTLDRVIIHLNDSVYGSDSLIHNIINQVGDDGNGKLFCASNVDSIGFRYSTDEGDHWVKLPLLPQQDPKQPIEAFAFASGDTIIAASGTLGTTKYFLSTDDGVSWRLLSDNTTTLASQLLIHPNGSYLARVKSGGGIYLSADLALTWQKIFPPEGFPSFKIYYDMMIDKSGDIIVCTDSGVYRSVNGNLSNWSSVSDGLTANDVPGHFISCAGVVENPITHVFFAATHGLGVFKSVPDLEGVKNTSAVSLDLMHSYPNPFSRSSNISFIVGKPGNISLSVYDILGNKVQNLYQGFSAEGNYTVQFDRGTLANGKYMIVLREGVENYSTWITLVK